MDKIPFRPIGERFNFGDVVLEVVADADFTYSDCPGCYFFQLFVRYFLPWPNYVY